MDVDGRGRVSVPDVASGQGSGRTEDQAEALSGRLDALARDCQRGIDQAVADAGDADRVCAAKLRALGTPIPTLKELNAASDRMGQRAKDAAAEAKRLMSQGLANLSEEDLQRLQSMLRHTDDPAFSTPFLEALGPRGALRLNVLFAEAGNSEMVGFDGLGQGLQEDLAAALASATDKTAGQHLSYVPRTPEERANDTSWIEELKQAGRTGMGTMGRESSLGLHGISGYHSLAALLDDADFSTGFLNEVGRDMYRFDVTENPDDWRRPGVLSGDFDLDLGDPSESGLDPMSGLMQGLQNNPEAAREFFAHHFDDLGNPAARSPVDYLLTERDWGDGSNIPGTSSLGDALAAATTDVRNEQAAQIMGEAVHHLGSDPDAQMPANMRDSFGRMFDYWIDDVHNAIAPGGTRDPSEAGFVLHRGVDDPAIPGSEGVHVGFDNSELIRVMSDAAKDPNAYQQMWSAEQKYVASLLDHEAGKVDPDGEDPLRDFQGAAQTSGKVFGVLMEANGAAAQQLTESQNAALGMGGESAKVGISAVGATAGTVVGGPAGTVAGAAATGGATWAVDQLVAGAQADNLDAAESEIAKMYGDGRYNVSELVQDAMWRNELHGNPVPDHLRYPNGEPIPYSEMTGEQRAYYDDVWMREHGNGIRQVQGNTANSVTTGESLHREATDPFGRNR